MEIKAVIFDMDGTLFDSERLAQQIWYQLGEEFQLPVCNAFLRDLAGRDWNSAAPVFAQYFPKEWPLQQAKERQRVLFEEFYATQGADPKPGFYEILSFLKQRQIPMAIATSAFMKCVQANLKHADANDYFDAIVTGYDPEVKAGKPAPDIYLCAARRLQVPIENCIVVEDSPTGILAAANAGAYPLLIPDAAKVDDEIRSKATWILERLDQMIPLFDKEAEIK